MGEAVLRGTTPPLGKVCDLTCCDIERLLMMKLWWLFIRFRLPVTKQSASNMQVDE